LFLFPSLNQQLLIFLCSICFQRCFLRWLCPHCCFRRLHRLPRSTSDLLVLLPLCPPRAMSAIFLIMALWRITLRTLDQLFYRLSQNARRLVVQPFTSHLEHILVSGLS
jgi:ABC-type phosphate/phosphonate transport system permease subunit